MFLNSILFAITLSIDSIGIGITYGLKNTKIKISSKCILFGISFFFCILSLLAGNLLIHFISPVIANVLGIFLLIFLGLMMIYQGIFPHKKSSKIQKKNSSKIHQFFIKPLGITIQIIRNPISSDFDDSNTIDGKEALFLGTALSLDSFAGGIGIATLGVNPIFFPLFVSIFQLLFLSFGNVLGKKIKSTCKFPTNIWTILSGLLFLLIAFFRILSFYSS